GLGTGGRHGLSMRCAVAAGFLLAVSTLSGGGQTVIAPTQSAPAVPRYNRFVLDAIRRMPSGGEYSATSGAMLKLASSHGIEEGEIVVHPEVARPSFCS